MLKKIAISLLSTFVIMTSCYYVAFSDYYMEDSQMLYATNLVEMEEPILLAYNDGYEEGELELTKNEIENEYKGRYDNLKEKFISDMKKLEACDDSESMFKMILKSEIEFENEYKKIHGDMEMVLTFYGFSTEEADKIEKDAIDLKRKVKIHIIKDTAFRKEN